MFKLDGFRFGVVWLVAVAMAAAAAPRGSSASRSSSSGSNSSTCARLVPAPVIAVSPSHTLEYDCTDCGSFLFGHRGRLRPRPQGTRSSGHPHSRGSSVGEHVQVLNPCQSSLTSYSSFFLFHTFTSFLAYIFFRQFRNERRGNSKTPMHSNGETELESWKLG